MCTVILAHRVLDDTPILLGANRDEHLARPSEPPQLCVRDSSRVLSPRDLKAGGTWLGVNEHEVVVAITNRFGKPADGERRSRGELVDLALTAPSASAAADRVAGLPASDYNGFHLLCVDADQANLVWSDGERLSRSTLSTGLIVMTERSLGAADNARKERVLAECRKLLETGVLDEAALKRVLSKCDDGSIDATCVSIPSLDYGTRSSTIIRLGATNRVLHAEGAPCATDYDDLSSLLEDLTTVNTEDAGRKDP